MGKSVFAGLAVFGVSVYLALVGAWLLATHAVPGPGFKKLFRAQLRRRYSGPIQEFSPEDGYCFVAPIRAELLSDQDSASSLVLFENGREIGSGHCSHDEIRRLGLGRYSHWGSALYFSTPDNTDPRANGREYSVREVCK